MPKRFDITYSEGAEGIGEGQVTKRFWVDFLSVRPESTGADESIPSETEWERMDARKVKRIEEAPE